MVGEGGFGRRVCQLQCTAPTMYALLLGCHGPRKPPPPPPQKTITKTAPCQTPLPCHPVPRAERALRILALARRSDLPAPMGGYDGTPSHPATKLLAEASNYARIESDLVFVGLAGLQVRGGAWAQAPGSCSLLAMGAWRGCWRLLGTQAPGSWTGLGEQPPGPAPLAPAGPSA